MSQVAVLVFDDSQTILPFFDTNAKHMLDFSLLQQSDSETLNPLQIMMPIEISFAVGKLATEWLEETDGNVEKMVGKFQETMNVTNYETWFEIVHFAEFLGIHCLQEASAIAVANLINQCSTPEQFGKQIFPFSDVLCKRPFKRKASEKMSKKCS